MKELLLGPPLATSRLTRERLRKLSVLILSYRQTITAYPSAGGAYVVTVLLPGHGDLGGWRRLLHDQTGRELLAALGRLPGVNVTVVRGPARPATTRPPVRRAGPRRLDFPASGNAHRHPALRSLEA